jgi:hypothetical protein
VRGVDQRWIAIAFAIAFASGCNCAFCSSDEAIAELVDKSGTVDRDFAASVNTWQVADPGASFSIGDGVRTGRDARATLELRGGAQLEMDPSSEIRFERGTEESERIDVRSGIATLEAGDEESRIETELGMAILSPGTRVELTSTGSNLSVLVGSAVLETEEGPVRLAQGQAFNPVTQSVVSRPPEVANETELVPRPQQELTAQNDNPPGNTLAVTTAGRVDRREGDAWENIPAGTHLIEAGTRLRLARNATAVVQRGDNRVRAMGAGEVVVGPSESELLEAIAGRARIDANDAEVRVRVPGGVIVATIDGGPTSGTFEIGPEQTEVRAARGRIVLREGEEESVVEPGDLGTIERSADEEVEPTEEPVALEEDETLGPPEITLPAGGSFVVHDPAPPLVVQFGAEEGCRVDIRGSRGSTVHRLDRGRTSYTVQCPGRSRRRRGNIVVLRDSGQASLPVTPPESTIQADGHNYTVHYENQLPIITIELRDQTIRGPYRLRFLSGNRAPQTSPRPSFAFASGDIPDGSHRFVIEGSGGRASRETQLRIRFDNTARTASVRGPNNGSFSPGQSVAVSGIALPGWSVAVEGRSLSLDPQHRFETTITAPAGPIVIRLSHPRHGVHYYLRRPRGSG